LFASVDTSCEGVNSTYRIIVGRSTSITGPDGESVFTDTDGAILVYHYYDGNNSGQVNGGSTIQASVAVDFMSQPK